MSDLEYHALAHELYSGIDEDPEHELDDWEECGHIVTELEIAPGHWMPQSEVLKSPEASALVRQLLEAGRMNSRPRKMSRGEVWRAGAADLVKITGEGVCAILGDDLAVPRRVQNNRFEFTDAEVGPGLHRFDSIAFNFYGEALQLKDGENYETFVNPFAPDMMFVRRADGSYIGECRRMDKPCRGDAEAVQRACGEAAKREKELLLPMRNRHIAEAREKARRHGHNADVLSGGPVTAEEQAAAREAARTSKSAARFGEILRELDGESRNAEVGTRNVTDGNAADTAATTSTEEEIETW